MSDKERLLEHLASEIFCRLGVSPIHGIGVFALRAIGKGIDPLRSPVRNRGVAFSHDEIKKLPAGVRQQLKIFCYYDEDGYVIPSIGMNTMDLAIYLNHSKTPNVRMKKNGSFVSLRSIRKGEELTMDYDDSFGDTHIF